MITRKSLFVGAYQGNTEDDKPFGFVGTNATDDYQGWFFTYPTTRISADNKAEIEEIVSSLDADDTCPNDPQIPLRWAQQVLRKHLNSRRCLPSRHYA